MPDFRVVFEQSPRTRRHINVIAPDYRSAESAAYAALHAIDEGRSINDALADTADELGLQEHELAYTNELANASGSEQEWEIYDTVNMSPPPPIVRPAQRASVAMRLGADAETGPGEVDSRLNASEIGRLFQARATGTGLGVAAAPQAPDIPEEEVGGDLCWRPVPVVSQPLPSNHPDSANDF